METSSNKSNLFQTVQQSATASRFMTDSGVTSSAKVCEEVGLSFKAQSVFGSFLSPLVFRWKHPGSNNEKTHRFVINKIPLLGDNGCVRTAGSLHDKAKG